MQEKCTIFPLPQKKVYHKIALLVMNFVYVGWDRESGAWGVGSGEAHKINVHLYCSTVIRLNYSTN